MFTFVANFDFGMFASNDAFQNCDSKLTLDICNFVFTAGSVPPVVAKVGLQTMMTVARTNAESASRWSL